ncbi:MAG: hypothetical protein ABGX22_16580 [Pirellulaceae bacterium]
MKETTDISETLYGVGSGIQPRFRVAANSRWGHNRAAQMNLLPYD